MTTSWGLVRNAFTSVSSPILVHPPSFIILLHQSSMVLHFIHHSSFSIIYHFVHHFIHSSPIVLPFVHPLSSPPFTLRPSSSLFSPSSFVLRPSSFVLRPSSFVHRSLFCVLRSLFIHHSLFRSSFFTLFFTLFILSSSLKLFKRCLVAPSQDRQHFLLSQARRGQRLRGMADYTYSTIAAIEFLSYSR